MKHLNPINLITYIFNLNKIYIINFNKQICIMNLLQSNRNNYKEFKIFIKIIYIQVTINKWKA